ncbi:hypothetical protein Tco_0442257 [Tanacetum coccineum]
MSTYLKNKAGYKHNQLKNKSFDDIQKLFDKAMKKVNTFVDTDTELVEEEDKESEELKQCLEIILDDGDDVTIDATPLSTKSLTIIDYKIYKEGKKSYFQIIRADGNSQISSMEESTGLQSVGLEIIMTCGVHSLRMQHMHIHMLVEKRYPLTPATITDMLNKKLQCDHFSEMVINFLKTSHITLKNHEGRIVRIKRLHDDLEVTVAKFCVTAAKLKIAVIMEYLVNISKRRAFWSLNEDILKITILTTNTSYPSRKIRRIRAFTHQRPQRKLDQYAVSSEDQYAILEI